MLMDWNVIHTEPGHGEGQPFSPPSDPGSPEAYLSWLRSRWAHDPGQRQRLGVLARMMKPAVGFQPHFSGPYAEQARRVLSKL